VTARRRRKARVPYELEVAPDVQARLEDIVRRLPDRFAHVDVRRVVCFRSRGATARIYARIWALPRIFQIALGVEAHYAVEVVEAFDRRDGAEQDRTLVHELMHIPKTFSGALVPHRCFGRNIDCSSVEMLYQELVRRRGSEKEPSPPSPGPCYISPTSSGIEVQDVDGRNTYSPVGL